MAALARGVANYAVASLVACSFACTRAPDIGASADRPPSADADDAPRAVDAHVLLTPPKLLEDPTSSLPRLRDPVHRRDIRGTVSATKTGVLFVNGPLEPANEDGVRVRHTTLYRPRPALSGVASNDAHIDHGRVFALAGFSGCEPLTATFGLLQVLEPATGKVSNVQAPTLCSLYAITDNEHIRYGRVNVAEDCASHNALVTRDYAVDCSAVGQSCALRAVGEESAPQCYEKSACTQDTRKNATDLYGELSREYDALRKRLGLWDEVHDGALEPMVSFVNAGERQRCGETALEECNGAWSSVVERSADLVVVRSTRTFAPVDGKHRYGTRSMVYHPSRDVYETLNASPGEAFDLGDDFVLIVDARRRSCGAFVESAFVFDARRATTVLELKDAAIQVGVRVSGAGQATLEYSVEERRPADASCAKGYADDYRRTLKLECSRSDAGAVCTYEPVRETARVTSCRAGCN